MFQKITAEVGLKYQKSSKCVLFHQEIFKSKVPGKSQIISLFENCTSPNNF